MMHSKNKFYDHSSEINEMNVSLLFTNKNLDYLHKRFLKAFILRKVKVIFKDKSKYKEKKITFN